MRAPNPSRLHSSPVPSPSRRNGGLPGCGGGAPAGTPPTSCRRAQLTRWGCGGSCRPRTRPCRPAPPQCAAAAGGIGGVHVVSSPGHFSCVVFCVDYQRYGGVGRPERAAATGEECEQQRVPMGAASRSRLSQLKECTRAPSRHTPACHGAQLCWADTSPQNTHSHKHTHTQTLQARMPTWLYLDRRSERQGAPVLIWPVDRPTAKSAMNESSVSPELQQGGGAACG
jgi:hypothetical protein